MGCELGRHWFKKWRKFRLILGYFGAFLALRAETVVEGFLAGSKSGGNSGWFKAGLRLYRKPRFSVQHFKLGKLV